MFKTNRRFNILKCISLVTININDLILISVSSLKNTLFWLLLDERNTFSEWFTLLLTIFGAFATAVHCG